VWPSRARTSVRVLPHVRACDKRCCAVQSEQPAECCVCSASFLACRHQHDVMLRFMAVFLYKNKSSNTIGILVDTDGAAAGPWCDAWLEPWLQPVSKPKHSVQNQTFLSQHFIQNSDFHPLSSKSPSAPFGWRVFGGKWIKKYCSG